VHWLVLFLDLVAPVAPHGPAADDAALYHQVMADHHLTAGFTLDAGFAECEKVARGASDLADLAAEFLNANWRPVEHGAGETHFSFVGRANQRAYVELKTSEATFCELYRWSGASYRLVREVRLPRPLLPGGGAMRPLAAPTALRR
jgi:hypothetical protein